MEHSAWHARDTWVDLRDEKARVRDLTADARDAAADLRDREAEAQAGNLVITDECEALVRELHLAASMARDEASADREQAANDRRLAAVDRTSAGADRGSARLELREAGSDGLTGVQRRDLGRVALQDEIERSRRSGEPFALAFVDVDGLKQLNDFEGHAAGDELLQAVAAALKTGRRSYDPIVRIGGDEFLCGFTNTDLTACGRRVEDIRGSLIRMSDTASISVGVAALADGDTLESLIARADANMYDSKNARL
jgi:diguanylate cyclase (GGDEF)-like protein